LSNSITEGELTKIVAKFYTNEDGKISITEFKNYCYYEMTYVTWRAERARLEKVEKKAQLSRRFKITDALDDNDCGDEVHRTSKFFWKKNNNLEIRIFSQSC